MFRFKLNMAASSSHVAILGCGVIGLSTAVAILEGQAENARGSRRYVSIVAKEAPDLDDESRKKSVGNAESHSAEYASVWAGAHHVSDAKSERELRHDKITFERMSKLARERPWSKQTTSSSTRTSSPVLPIRPAPINKDAEGSAEPLVWVHQTELFEKASGEGSKRPPYEGVLDWYPDFKAIPSSSLASGHGWGCTFSTIDINVPLYHKWLLQRFLDLGGRLVIADVNSLREAIQLASKPPSHRTICKHPSVWVSAGKVDVLVASPGLGARSIHGLTDQAVHPQRGQVVVVHAPWLSTDDTLPTWSSRPRHKLPGYSIVRAQGGREVYVIPRGDGTVICGGTRIIDDWDGKPRPETTRKILKRCLELVPQLVHPSKRSGLGKPRVEDVKVLEVNVGLRPARRGGVRLERAKEDVDGVKVVHNYGYGGAGYQASWGAALDAQELVEQALAKPRSPLTPFAKL
ncbi:DAO domain-containing protein [Pseudozyma hubeiensis]|nr:DAO domain-containing protein [Pseudozyma hubeiensis]